MIKIDSSACSKKRVVLFFDRNAFVEGRNNPFDWVFGRCAAGCVAASLRNPAASVALSD